MAAHIAWNGHKIGGLESGTIRVYKDFTWSISTKTKARDGNGVLYIDTQGYNAAQAGVTLDLRAALGDDVAGLIEEFKNDSRSGVCARLLVGGRDLFGANYLLTGVDVSQTQIQPMTGTMTRAWLVSCVLTSATSGGIEKEEDEAYRARIIESTFRKNATGSRAQYKAVALAVSSAILDASPVADENFVSGVGKDYGLRPGQVMVSLMFSDTLSEQEKKQILEDTWQALSSDESRPLTDTIVVREAKEKTYALKVRCKLQNDDAANEDRLSAVYSAQAAYEAWQSAAIGRAFDPYRLTSMLYNAGCSRVDIDAAESSFDGGEATYTEIDRATRITGRVNLEVQT